MSKVEIYHNVAPNGAGFFGLNTVLILEQKLEATGDDRHPLVKVYEYPTEIEAHETEADDLNLCEAAFAMFNNGSGHEDARYFSRKLRSLSVGDVVVIDDRAYSCETAGFKRRGAAELLIMPDFDPVGQFGEYAVSVPWVDIDLDGALARTNAFRVLIKNAPEAFQQPPGRRSQRLTAEFLPALRDWYEGGQQVELAGFTRAWLAEHDSSDA